jgi:Transcriptional repressor TCF25
VELDLMNGEREEKQLFGHAVVSRERKRREAEERARAQQMASLMGRRGRRQQARGGKLLGVVSARLVRTGADWPRTPTGVHMELVSATRHESVFAVRWSPTYRQQQAAFEACVQTNDPQMLMGLLRQYPYHVDTLLQIAQLYKQLGELEKSADLVARCVYVFERSWHARFDVSHGCSRLCYERNPECRSFFVALFRHIQILGRKGCCRTALEYCRLLLALDPTDPLFVLLNVDYFALRSDQYSFLFELVQHYPATRVCEWMVTPPPSSSPAEVDRSPADARSDAASRNRAGKAGGGRKGRKGRKGKAHVRRAGITVQRRPDMPSDEAGRSSSATTAVSVSTAGSAAETARKTYRSLLLPNILYSVALARFHVERRRAGEEGTSSCSSGLAGTSAVAEDAATTASSPTSDSSPVIPLCQLPSQFRAASSSQLLQDALLMFPMVYAPLAAKIGMQGGVSPPALFAVDRASVLFAWLS